MTEATSYTIEEVAGLLKVSKLTVYDLIKKGLIPAYRVGRQMRVDEEDLKQYKANMRMSKKPSAAEAPDPSRGRSRKKAVRYHQRAGCVDGPPQQTAGTNNTGGSAPQVQRQFEQPDRDVPRGL